MIEAGVNESDGRGGLKSDEGAEVSFDGDIGKGCEGVGEGFDSLRVRAERGEGWIFIALGVLQGEEADGPADEEAGEGEDGEEREDRLF